MTDQIKPGDIEFLMRFREMMGRFPVNDTPDPWAEDFGGINRPINKKETKQNEPQRTERQDQ